MGTELHLSTDHPVALELKSLRNAVATFQHEAHEASLKLQKYSLDSSRSFERTRELESENTRLKEEIAVLRAKPDISPHPDSLQVQELDLAHRRLLDQLSITEATLELRTTELTNAQGELLKARQDAEGAFELASHIRAREEEGKLRERELLHKSRAAEEERRMADLVVTEYASLVRSLEGRKSSLSLKAPPKSPDIQENGVVYDQSTSTNAGITPPLVDSYTEGKKGLQRLLGEFTVESERLEEKIAKLERELATVETRWEAERKTAELDRTLLANVQSELVKLRIDDKAAARMVSRYMQFSQHSTVALQNAMNNLKVRHAATVSTLSLEIDHLQISLASDRRHTKKLKAALDDLLEDISRETYGRRREVSLRLALLLREATVAEGLQRWSRKARELFYHSAKGKGGTQASFEKCVEGAEALLQTLNSDTSLEMDTGGSVARILAAQDAVATLVQELHVETGKRLELERQRALGLVSVPPVPIVAPSSDNEVKPVLSAESCPSSKHTRINDVSPATRDIKIATSSPNSGAVVNGTPDVVGAPADASHTPSPSLLKEIPAVDDSAPEPEQGAAGSITRALVESIPEHPGDSEIDVIIASVGVVHQPAPRSLQEASFVNVESSSRVEPPSNFSPLPSSSFRPPLALDKSSELNTIALPTSLQTTAAPPFPSTRNSLLSELDGVRHRYDELQRAFRDCHLTLKDLKNNISSILPVTETVAILRAAIQRLDDFNEDARVELEIRITDEELTARGYQTLLNVPGAISDDTDPVEVENRIRAFADGTEKTVTKTTEQLRRKLDDLQHDVALVKKSLHDLPDLELQQPLTPQTSTGWSSWTNILSGSPRSASPAPPTFGTVMTSPRLRHSSSFTQSHVPGHKPSSADSSAAPRIRLDPFASLGLRISMPSHVMSPTASLGVDQSPSPSRSGSGPRTLSATYMLGLGSKSTSLAVNSPRSANSTHLKSAAPMLWSDQLEDESATDGEAETEAEDEDELQTDVE